MPSLAGAEGAQFDVPVWLHYFSRLGERWVSAFASFCLLASSSLHVCPAPPGCVSVCRSRIPTSDCVSLDPCFSLCVSDFTWCFLLMRTSVLLD